MVVVLHSLALELGESFRGSSSLGMAGEVRMVRCLP
jgi:hypothetical protein